MSAAAEQARTDLQAGLAGKAAVPGLEAQVVGLRHALATARELLGRAQYQASVETAEMERWDGKGFGPLLLWLLGRIDERREREHEEAAQAALRLADQRSTVDGIEQRLDATLNKLAAARSAAASIPAASAAMRASLQHDPAFGDQLVALEAASALAATEVRETDEAIAAVDVALRCIERANAQLDSADGWATWDLIGGGMISSMVKNGKVDDALQEVHELNAALRRVRDELGQVNTPVEVPAGLEAGSSARTFDVWFDNVFSDWNSKSRIHSMQQSLAALRTTLQQMHEALAEHRRLATRRQAAAERDLTSLLAR